MAQGSQLLWLVADQTLRASRGSPVPYQQRFCSPVPTRDWLVRRSPAQRASLTPTQAALLL